MNNGLAKQLLKAGLIDKDKFEESEREVRSALEGGRGRRPVKKPTWDREENAQAQLSLTELANLSASEVVRMMVSPGYITHKKTRYPQVPSA